jgi:hypothetical protein
VPAIDPFENGAPGRIRPPTPTFVALWLRLEARRGRRRKPEGGTPTQLLTMNQPNGGQPFLSGESPRVVTHWSLPCFGQFFQRRKCLIYWWAVFDLD